MFWIVVLRKRPIFVFQAHTWTHWRHLQGLQMSRRRSERRWMKAIVTWRIYFFFDLRRHWQLLLFQLKQGSNDWEPVYQDRWSPTPNICHLSMESRSYHLGVFGHWYSWIVIWAPAVKEFQPTLVPVWLYHYNCTVARETTRWFFAAQPVMTKWIDLLTT